MVLVGLFWDKVVIILLVSFGLKFGILIMLLMVVLCSDCIDLKWEMSVLCWVFFSFDILLRMDFIMVLECLDW